MDHVWHQKDRFNKYWFHRLTEGAKGTKGDRTLPMGVVAIQLRAYAGNREVLTRKSAQRQKKEGKGPGKHLQK